MYADISFTAMTKKHKKEKQRDKTDISIVKTETQATSAEENAPPDDLPKLTSLVESDKPPQVDEITKPTTPHFGLLDDKISSEKKQTSTLKDAVVSRANSMTRIKNKFKRETMKLHKTTTLVDIFTKTKNKYGKRMKDITLQKQQQLLGSMLEYLETTVNECQNNIDEAKVQYRQLKALENKIANIESALLKTIYQLNMTLALKKNENTNRVYIYSQYGINDTPFI